MKKVVSLSIIAVTLVAAILFSSFVLKKGDRKVTIRSYHETYVCADLNKSAQLFADRKEAGDWETFTIVDKGDGKINIKGFNGKYVSLNEKDGKLYCNAVAPGEWETFTLVTISDNWQAIRANNGKYLSADKKEKMQVLANRATVQEWESFLISDK